MRTTRRTARQPNRPRHSAPLLVPVFSVPQLSPQPRQVRLSEAQVSSEARPQLQRVSVAQNYLVLLPPQLPQQQVCSGQVLSPPRRLRFLAHLLRQLLLQASEALQASIPLRVNKRQQASLVRRKPSRVSSVVWAKPQLPQASEAFVSLPPQQQQACSEKSLRAALRIAKPIARLYRRLTPQKIKTIIKRMK